jgi:hypothetical protein
MNIINEITSKFSDTKSLNDSFVLSKPFPSIVIDDFLPTDIATQLYEESLTVPDEHWKVFTRNNSHMMELNNLELCPIATQLVAQMHSAKGMKWLSEVSGIPQLLCDPYLVGAGYSKSFNGDSLKVHTDFNWNDQLKLHRLLSLIIYITPDWKPEYGGGLDFYDFKRKDIVKTVNADFNRCLIWKYHKKGFHGYNDPINCPKEISRNAFKLFFYVSSSEYNPTDRPHRSLYWYDEETNEPYDIPTKK